MTDVRAGQLIASSLQEAIQIEMPQRLEFYEHWLGGERRPDRRGNLAALSAVLGFLRTEGESYDRVMARAGRAAAVWTVEGLAPWRLGWAGRLPTSLRARAALVVAGELVRAVHGASRLRRRVRKHQAELGVTASPFCSVRQTPATPLCGFYLAAALEILARFDLDANGHVASCHAIGGGRCVMVIDWSGHRHVAGPAVAA